MVMPAAPMGPAATPGQSPSPSPTGSSLAGPSASPGTQVNGIAKVRQSIKLLESALSDLGSESDIGGAILSAIKGLSSKAPENKTTAGAESSALQGLAAKAKQAAPMLALARAQGQGGAAPGASPGGQPGAM